MAIAAMVVKVLGTHQDGRNQHQGASQTRSNRTTEFDPIAQQLIDGQNRHAHPNTEYKERTRQNVIPFARLIRWLIRIDDDTHTRNDKQGQQT